MKVKTKAYKDESGAVLASIISEEGHEMILNMGQFSKLQDQVDEVLYGQKVALSQRNGNDIVPEMYVSEMHDFLFGMELSDGTKYSKGLSLVLSMDIKNRMNTDNPFTYGELFERTKHLLNTVFGSEKHIANKAGG